MKEALYWEVKEKDVVQCLLCPKLCVIKEGGKGQCHVRQNIKGKLYSMVYGKPCAIAVDPIEKKPLYHFLPGSTAFSVGTIGCNLHCRFCQNWETSQAYPEDFEFKDVSPDEIVKQAKKSGCESIAYTYNDPVVFYEYALDIAKKAKGLRNIIVCNGFINQEPLKEWCKHIDAANIDLKAFDDKFYRENTTAWLNPILESLKTIKKMGVWLEITNLIIPGLNDDMKKIKKMCAWIFENLGSDVPLHFTAFYPCYQMMDRPRTPAVTLMEAMKVALRAGLNYVYVGNVDPGEGSNTYCPKSKKLAVSRYGFSILQNHIKEGRCNGERIAGVWK
ncbi:MAG: AmmeMemoRadiSam system radical SAM enzyme [Nanoarchaeota archaeon]|nr:AmmeMemoRadiSam system radical SAM enzyme [Nanoarchaeota archaeon]